MTTTLRMTDAELIQACLANDRLAQKALYDRYCNAMFTLAYRITGEQDSAADVLQEAFVKVFTHLAGFRQESTLGAWIKVIVTRTALSKLRKQPRWEELTPNHQEETIDWGHRIDIDYLDQAIQSLPVGYRTVFWLIEVEGYGHKEVAEMLGISEGTSKSQLFYAKKRLREMLESVG